MDPEKADIWVWSKHQGDQSPMGFLIRQWPLLSWRLSIQGIFLIRKSHWYGHRKWLQLKLLISLKLHETNYKCTIFALAVTCRIGLLCWLRCIIEYYEVEVLDCCWGKCPSVCSQRSLNHHCLLLNECLEHRSHNAQFLDILKLTACSWKAGSVVKTTGSSCTRPEFGSLHPYWVAHNCL